MRGHREAVTGLQARHLPQHAKGTQGAIWQLQDCLRLPICEMGTAQLPQGCGVDPVLDASWYQPCSSSCNEAICQGPSQEC
jgi:hypothetical protein